MTKKYNYDLRKMERDLEDSYRKMIDTPTEETKTTFIISIKEISLAILRVGTYWKQFKVDFEEVSYDYSVYVYERIFFKNWRPEGKENIQGKRIRFPWQKYIRLNLRNIIFGFVDKDYRLDFFEDISDLIDAEDQSDYCGSFFDDKRITKSEFSRKMYSGIKMFYPWEEIKRLYPISMKLLPVFLKGKKYKQSLPEDIKKFLSIIISLSKRVSYLTSDKFTITESVSSFKDALASSTRSTIFLASLIDNKIYNRELILSLDIDSLYRLAYSVGGETIRVPSVKELNNLIGMVVASGKSIVEDRDPLDCIAEAKDDMSLSYSTIKDIRINEMMKNMVTSHKLNFQSESSDSIMSQLLLSTKTLKFLLEKISEKSSDMSQSEALNKYSELSESFTLFLNSLTSISSKVENINSAIQ